MEKKKLEVCICNNSSSAGIGCCIDAASYSRATLEYLLAGHVYNIDKYLTGLFYLLGHPVFQTRTHTYNHTVFQNVHCCVRQKAWHNKKTLCILFSNIWSSTPPLVVDKKNYIHYWERYVYSAEPFVI